MLFVIDQIIGRDAKRPSGKGAFASERRQVRDDFEQDVLRGVLRVRKAAQHPQGKVEHHIPHA